MSAGGSTPSPEKATMTREMERTLEDLFPIEDAKPLPKEKKEPKWARQRTPFRSADLGKQLHAAARALPEIPKGTQGIVLPPKEDGSSGELVSFMDYPEGTPNVFNRGSFWGAGVRPADADEIKVREIYCMKGYSVARTGPFLSTDDKLVWEHLIKMLRDDRIPAGQETPISIRRLLREMKKSHGSGNFEMVYNCLWRIRQTSMTEVRVHGRRRPDWVDFNLLMTYGGGGEDDDRLVLAVHPRAAKMYSCDVTRIALERKLGLKGKLAAWLHDFYSSHQKSVPFTIDELRKLSGATANDKNFTEALRKALVQLETCTPPLLKPGSRVEKGLVHTEKAEQALVFIGDLDLPEPTKTSVAL